MFPSSALRNRLLRSGSFYRHRDNYETFFFFLNEPIFFFVAKILYWILSTEITKCTRTEHESGPIRLSSRLKDLWTVFLATLRIFIALKMMTTMKHRKSLATKYCFAACWMKSRNCKPLVTRELTNKTFLRAVGMKTAGFLNGLFWAVQRIICARNAT